MTNLYDRDPRDFGLFVHAHNTRLDEAGRLFFITQAKFRRKSELTLINTGMNDFYWRKSELTLINTGMNDFYWGKWQLTIT